MRESMRLQLLAAAGRAGSLAWVLVRRLLRPFQGPEARRLVAILLLAWSVGYEVGNFTVLGAVGLGLETQNLAHLQAWLMGVAGLWLLLTLTLRATWLGRIGAILAGGLLVMLTVWTLPARWVSSLTYMVFVWVCVGEALIFGPGQKGQKGDPGPEGPKGERGLQGVPGPQGQAR